MKPTFEKTVDILVKAYLNGTLKHSDCSACAVGNIVHGYGVPLSKGCIEPGKNNVWKWVFYTERGSKIQTIDVCKNRKNFADGLKVIDATGYDWHDLAKVEYAFETSPEGDSEDEHMLNGLMAVVDVLAEIHGVDLTQREEAKLLFQKS